MSRYIVKLDKKKLMDEAGGRCSICGLAIALQHAHIVPFRICRKSTFEELIILCSNCHGGIIDGWKIQEFAPELLYAFKIRPRAIREKYVDNDPNSLLEEFQYISTRGIYKQNKLENFLLSIATSSSLLSNPNLVARTALCWATIAKQRGKTHPSKYLAKILLQTFKKLNDYGNMIATNQLYAGSLFIERSFDKALDIYLKNEQMVKNLSKVSQKTRNKFLIDIYRDQGITYAFLGNSNKAFELTLESEQLAEKLNDKRCYALALQNEGMIHLTTKRIEKSMESLEKVSRFIPKDEIIGSVMLFNYLGALYLIAGDKEKKNQMAKKAICWSKQYGFYNELNIANKIKKSEESGIE